MINHNDLSEIKKDLQQRKHELAEKINADKIRKSEEEYSTELSDYDNHPGDSATELYEREKDLAITTHEITELEEINKALGRIQDDNYGICDVCGTEIAIDRLKARPETTVCIDHAESKTQTQEEKDHSISSLEIDDTDSWNTLADYGSSQSSIDRDSEDVGYNDTTEQSEDDYPDKMDAFSNEDDFKKD